MGMLMSYMGGPGVELSSQGLTWISGTLYDRFIEKQIKDFEAFHTAILDIFNAINMALPGKHYDAPARHEIAGFYEKWNKFEDDINYKGPLAASIPEEYSETWKSEDDKKKEAFTKFMLENVNLSKADESMMITGIVAPPVAMVAKRTGQSVPQLSVIKAIPDVAFVPAATIALLIVVKLSKRMAFKNIPS